MAQFSKSQFQFHFGCVKDNSFLVIYETPSKRHYYAGELPVTTPYLLEVKCADNPPQRVLRNFYKTIIRLLPKYKYKTI